MLAAALLAVAFLATGLALTPAVRAQDQPAPSSPPSGTAAPVAPGTQAVKGYEVEGFRSARFGMTEAEVRRAIQVDFNVKDTAIAKETSPLERTTILSVAARDVLPEVGIVKIFYILGYTHRKLIQVNLAWGAGVSDTSPNSTNVLAAAQLLGNYFLGQSFRPENRVLNAQLSDGSSLLFQGLDEKGRMVQLLYGTTAPSAQPGEKQDDGKPPPRLPFGRLSYIEDARNPDIFRIKPGQF